MSLLNFSQEQHKYVIANRSKPFMTNGRGECVIITIRKIIDDNDLYTEFDEYQIQSNGTIYQESKFQGFLTTVTQEFINVFKPLPASVCLVKSDFKKWKINKENLYKIAKNYDNSVKKYLTKTQYANILIKNNYKIFNLYMIVQKFENDFNLDRNLIKKIMSQV